MLIRSVDFANQALAFCLLFTDAAHRQRRQQNARRYRQIHGNRPLKYSHQMHASFVPRNENLQCCIFSIFRVFKIDDNKHFQQSTQTNISVVKRRWQTLQFFKSELDFLNWASAYKYRGRFIVCLYFDGALFQLWSLFFISRSKEVGKHERFSLPGRGKWGICRLCSWRSDIG